MLNLVFGAGGAPTSCDQPTYRAARFAPANKFEEKLFTNHISLGDFKVFSVNKDDIIFIIEDDIYHAIECCPSDLMGSSCQLSTDS